jgi:VIT1/CCC1 family predicted Fe2+/Mn2+ transporter
MTDLEKIQKNEITEYYVYKNMAERANRSDHRPILEKISSEELEHYNIIKKFTGKDIKPSALKIFIYTNVSRFLGLNFGLKLMENGEKNAESVYNMNNTAELKNLFNAEEEHEKALISMIDEEILSYISSVVLGLNDALVELTGALTGFTFALNNSKLVAVVGFITGIAASLSMGVSNYLEIKNEDSSDKHPLKSALYTFIAYLFTVILLILPYLIFSNIYVSLGVVIVTVVIIIAFFNFYTSVAKGLDFKKRFLEMFLLSMCVAFINYIIGYFMKNTMNINV